MRLHERLEPRRYEPRTQERTAERKAEMKQAQRLSAILARKADSAKGNASPDRSSPTPAADCGGLHPNRR